MACKGQIPLFYAILDIFIHIFSKMAQNKELV